MALSGKKQKTRKSNKMFFLTNLTVEQPFGVLLHLEKEKIKEEEIKCKTENWIHL